jgi:hypothetical protein
MKVLRDKAIFSESWAHRFRAIAELSKFGTPAIPLIREVRDSISSTDDEDSIRFEKTCTRLLYEIGTRCNYTLA